MFDAQDENKLRNQYSYSGYQTTQSKFNSAHKPNESNRTSSSTQNMSIESISNNERKLHSYSKNFKYLEEIETELDRTNTTKHPISLKRKVTLDRLTLKSAGSKSQREAKSVISTNDNIELKPASHVSIESMANKQSFEMLSVDNMETQAQTLNQDKQILAKSELEGAANDIATKFTTATYKLLTQLEIKFPGKTNEQTRLFLNQVRYI
jgi:hypothetical protein